MADEDGEAVPDTAVSTEIPYPGEGQAALLYSGTEPLSRDGLTFAPDSLQIVDEALAFRLAGHDNLRVVNESPQGWPHFLAGRARVKASQSG